MFFSGRLSPELPQLDWQLIASRVYGQINCTEQQKTLVLEKTASFGDHANLWRQALSEPGESLVGDYYKTLRMEG